VGFYYRRGGIYENLEIKRSFTKEMDAFKYDFTGHAYGVIRLTALGTVANGCAIFMGSWKRHHRTLPGMIILPKQSTFFSRALLEAAGLFTAILPRAGFLPCGRAADDDTHMTLVFQERY